MINELGTTLSDFALAFECFIFSYFLFKKTDNKYAWLFFFLGLSPLLGAIYHGFYGPSLSGFAGILWKMTLVSMGAMSLFSWISGLSLISIKNKIPLFIFLTEFVLYSLFVIIFNDKFYVAIINYIPSTLFLFFSFILIYRRKRKNTFLFSIIGLILIFAASAVQQLKFTIGSFIDHNTFYHVISLIALFMIFTGFYSIPSRKA